jgi:hypothetical protein
METKEGRQESRKGGKALWKGRKEGRKEGIRKDLWKGRQIMERSELFHHKKEGREE